MIKVEVVIATTQEINDAATLNSIKNARAYGYDNASARKRDDALWVKLGGDARFDKLMEDPQVYSYIAKGSGSGSFFGGLVDSIVTFAGEAGIKEGLLLGGLAFGVSQAGLFGGASNAATITAAPMNATFAGSVSALETGVTAAMEQAAMVSAAAAPGVAGAAAAAAEMAGASWATLATGEAATAGGLLDAFNQLRQSSAGQVYETGSNTLKAAQAVQKAGAAKDAAAQNGELASIYQQMAASTAQDMADVEAMNRELAALEGQQPAQQQNVVVVLLVAGVIAAVMFF